MSSPDRNTESSREFSIGDRSTKIKYLKVLGLQRRVAQRKNTEPTWIILRTMFPLSGKAYKSERTKGFNGKRRIIEAQNSFVGHVGSKLRVAD